MSIGSTLREARERKGLTIDDVAERTRMIHQMVDEMEHDDFHRVAAAIYGRGFIKLYSECVEIDPAPLLAEFNEVYTGFRKAPPEGEGEGVAGRSGRSGKAGKADETGASGKTEEPPKAVATPEVKPVTQPDPPAEPIAKPEAKPEPVVASEPEEKPEASPAAVPATITGGDAAKEEMVVSEATSPAAQANEEPAAETPSTLGELFDIERRNREEALRKPAPQPKREEPSHLNLNVTEEAPSWDDAPLSEGDFLHRILERLNMKTAAIAVAAVFICAVIVFAAVLVSKPSKSDTGDGGSAPDATEATDEAPTASADVIDPYTMPFAPPPDAYVK